MLSSPFRVCVRLLLAPAFCLLTVAARADLVWTPQTGWHVEGGALAGLAGPEGRNALDLMNKARTAENAGSIGSAIGSYKKVSTKYPNSVYAPEAFWRLGDLYLRRHQYLKSFTAYQELIERYPSSTRFNQIIGVQYSIATALVDGAHNRVWGWFPGFKHEDDGVAYYEKILISAPYSDYAPLALMNAARSYQKHDAPESAIDALDRMINNYPKHVLTPDAYLKIAQVYQSIVNGPYYDQSSVNDAITNYQDYLILFPGDKNVGEAEKGLNSMKEELAESKMKIANFYYYRRDNYTAAKVFYNEAITAYPDSTVAARARKLLAEVEAKADAAKKAAPSQQTPHKKFLGLF